MAIDTSQKRSSVFQLPGLMTNPFPISGVNAADRQQISDVYTGIAASMPPFLPSTTCWNDSRSNTSSWKTSSANTSTWKKTSTNTSAWVNEGEVTPCQD